MPCHLGLGECSFATLSSWACVHAISALRQSLARMIVPQGRAVQQVCGCAQPSLRVSLVRVSSRGDLAPASPLISVSPRACGKQCHWDNPKRPPPDSYNGCLSALHGLSTAWLPLFRAKALNFLTLHQPTRAPDGQSGNCALTSWK